MLSLSSAATTRIRLEDFETWRASDAAETWAIGKCPIGVGNSLGKRRGPRVVWGRKRDFQSCQSNFTNAGSS